MWLCTDDGVATGRRNTGTSKRGRTKVNSRSPALPNDHEDFYYREAFSCAEHEFLSSKEKSSS
jgi:hypothetical protein